MTANPEALIKIWNERHNLNLTSADAKAAFEDAQSSHAINTPLRTYDGDVAVLAPMLPDGLVFWNTQLTKPGLCWLPIGAEVEFFNGCWTWLGKYDVVSYRQLKITNPLSAKGSLLRIQGGKVVPV